ncbi:hypothetical protein ACLOJK_001157 [Asimina triloba]
MATARRRRDVAAAALLPMLCCGLWSRGLPEKKSRRVETAARRETELRRDGDGVAAVGGDGEKMVGVEVTQSCTSKFDIDMSMATQDFRLPLYLPKVAEAVTMADWMGRKRSSTAHTEKQLRLSKNAKVKRKHKAKHACFSKGY